MLSAAQQPLHGHAKVSQLDAIARLMAIKSQFSLSREAFDVMLTVVGSLVKFDGTIEPAYTWAHYAAVPNAPNQDGSVSRPSFG